MSRGNTGGGVAATSLEGLGMMRISATAAVLAGLIGGQAVGQAAGQVGGTDDERGRVLGFGHEVLLTSDQWISEISDTAGEIVGVDVAGPFVVVRVLDQRRALEPGERPNGDWLNSRVLLIGPDGLQVVFSSEREEPFVAIVDAHVTEAGAVAFAVEFGGNGITPGESASVFRWVNGAGSRGVASQQLDFDIQMVMNASGDIVLDVRDRQFIDGDSIRSDELLFISSEGGAGRYITPGGEPIMGAPFESRQDYFRKSLLEQVLGIDDQGRVLFSLFDDQTVPGERARFSTLIARTGPGGATPSELIAFAGDPVLGGDARPVGAIQAAATNALGDVLMLESASAVIRGSSATLTGTRLLRETAGGDLEVVLAAGDPVPGDWPGTLPIGSLSGLRVSDAGIIIINGSTVCNEQTVSDPWGCASFTLYGPVDALRLVEIPRQWFSMNAAGAVLVPSRFGGRFSFLDPSGSITRLVGEGDLISVNGEERVVDELPSSSSAFLDLHVPTGGADGSQSWMNDAGEVVLPMWFTDGTQAVVRFTPQRSCSLADLAMPAGALGLADVQTFLLAFGSGDLVADLEPDGALDVDDIQVFLQSFAAGCPGT